MKTSREYVGKCGVDAGCLMIGDPCYFFGPDCEAAKVHPTWESVLNQFDYGKGIPPPVQLNYAKGHAGLGVIVRTTHGDGTFPVYIETDINGKRRIVVELE